MKVFSVFNNRIFTTFVTLILVAIPLIYSATQSYSPQTSDAVHWMSFEEAIEKSKADKRKIFIDVYTDWCGWCKVMDKKTFSDPFVAQLLNKKFYAVKLNAEQKGDISFKGRTFSYISQGNKGVHELASTLLNNQMSYPNSVFLDEEYRIIPIYAKTNSVPGYHPPSDFHLFLEFISGEHYKHQNINEFQKTSYKSPYN